MLHPSAFGPAGRPPQSAAHRPPCRRHQSRPHTHAGNPPSTEICRRAAYDRLPRVKITDLLLEVDAWTGFSECFIHRRSGREADDRNALLTVILADGINLGLTRMAETCRGASLRQLAHLHDWHISEAAYGEALGRLINAHRTMPLAALWGDGTTSSSDGQQFHAGGRGAAIGDIDRKSVVEGKSVSVRVDLGGRRIVNKNNKKDTQT